MLFSLHCRRKAELEKTRVILKIPSQCRFKTENTVAKFTTKATYYTDQHKVH